MRIIDVDEYVSLGIDKSGKKVRKNIHQYGYLRFALATLQLIGKLWGGFMHSLMIKLVLGRHSPVAQW
ncbi:MAG: hypothetical protein AAB600_02745 [Patescibacteria group bacterium]